MLQLTTALMVWLSCTSTWSCSVFSWSAHKPPCQ